ncbi:uncharacterized protein [Panulirus ornatus]|uniref:uncharacterized protein n=1 Tax=Panulirus ornatus TaxID=150431 RepID=UPI003A8A71DA
MQLLDMVQPNSGDIPQRAGDVPFEAQNGFSVHNTCDRTTECQNSGRVLRHRCPLRNCGHRHINTRWFSTPGVYGHQDSGSGGVGGVKTRCYQLHHQPPRAHVPLSYTNPDRTTSPERGYPSPASSDHVTLFSRGLVTTTPPSQPQPYQKGYVPPAGPNAVIPRDYRKKAVQYIIKQLKVEGNQDIRKVHEIQRRIVSMENQIFHTITSQDEYVTKLASKLAAILQQLNQCRPAHLHPVCL